MKTTAGPEHSQRTAAQRGPGKSMRRHRPLKKFIPLTRCHACRRRGPHLTNTSGIGSEIKMRFKIFPRIRARHRSTDQLTPYETAQGILHGFLQRQIQLQVRRSRSRRFRRRPKDQNDNNRQRSAQKDTDPGKTFVALIKIEAHKKQYRQVQYPGADSLF
jgi:hypothetical protein